MSSHKDDMSMANSSTAGTVLSFEWMDEGTIDPRNQNRLLHEQIELRLQDQKIKVGINDALIVLTDDGKMFCRVERLWQSPEESILSVRWFHRPKEELKDFKDLQPNELVLSGEVRDIPVGTVLQKVNVAYQKSDEAWIQPKEGSYRCRYRLVRGSDINLIPYDQLDDSEKSESYDESSSSEESDEESVQSHIFEGEGTNKKGEIRIGSRYQAVVKPFNRNETVQSRNPKLIWSPGKVSEEELHKYLVDVGEILGPYLRENGMTTTEPYTPLRMDEAEELTRNNQLGGNSYLTGSNLSTASMLAGAASKRVAKLLKECEADAIMETLADHEFDRFAAIIAIKRSPRKYVAAWSRVERNIFDDNFRYSDGKLRSVCKAITPVKEMQQVVDYYYRFKIPDQFRRFQDKKRGQALKIVECIEKRRYHDQSVSPSDIEAPESKRRRASQWAEASVSESTGALEQRRQEAKKLLLDVQETLGEETLTNVAQLLKRLHRSYSVEMKDKLFGLLAGDKDLQTRFLKFIPMRP